MRESVSSAVLDGADIVYVARVPTRRIMTVGITIGRLAGLRPAFRQGGSVTAGDSSPINDGASAVLLGAEGAMDAEPLARIAGRAAFGNDPDVFGVAPVEAANRALARAGRRGPT